MYKKCTQTYEYRCEAFNKVMREYNVHSNRMASSRDIATKFAKLEQLRLICSGQTLMK